MRGMWRAVAVTATIILIPWVLYASLTRRASKRPRPLCRKVLWFLTVGRNVAAYSPHIRVAITSAKANAPSLLPHLIYDAPPDPLTTWVTAMGGVVLPHRLSFATRIEALPSPARLLEAGALLRLDIPLLVANLTLDTDEVETDWVLYTDPSVMILKDITSCTFRTPRVLLAGGQARRGEVANTGVMVINVTALRKEAPALVDFGFEHNWPADFEQQPTLRFFRDRLGLLEDQYNWKGYWGKGDPAILHFHGPTPLKGRGCLECLVLADLTGKNRTTCPCPSSSLEVYHRAEDPRFYAAMVFRWHIYLAAAMAGSHEPQVAQRLLTQQVVPT